MLLVVSTMVVLNGGDGSATGQYSQALYGSIFPGPVWNDIPRPIIRGIPGNIRGDIRGIFGAILGPHLQHISTYSWSYIFVRFLYKIA